MKFNKAIASSDELWEHCLKEYSSSNILVQFLINNYFKTLEHMLSSLDKNSNVLEVGCGAGESSRRIGALLTTQHFEVSEFDKRYITKIKSTDFPYPIRQESVYQLERNDNEFDCILLLEVLEHLEDVYKALDEVFRVSRRFVIISVPNEPIWRIMNMLRLKYLSAFGNTPGHINHWNKKQLTRLISQYGTVRKIYKPFPWIMLLAEITAQ